MRLQRRRLAAPGQLVLPSVPAESAGGTAPSDWRYRKGRTVVDLTAYRDCCSFLPMKIADIPQLKSLSVPEKLQLVTELWDEIVRQPDQMPIPEWHVNELGQDYAVYKANPREGKSWDEVKARIPRRK